VGVPAGLEAEGHGEMHLAHPDRAEEQRVLAVLQVGAGGKLAQLLLGRSAASAKLQLRAAASSAIRGSSGAVLMATRLRLPPRK